MVNLVLVNLISSQNVNFYYSTLLLSKKGSVWSLSGFVSIYNPKDSRIKDIVRLRYADLPYKYLLAS